MTFTPEEFDTIYTASQNKVGLSCYKLELCEYIGSCAKCPLYYMKPSDALLFVLNNTPDYPHDKTFYLETTSNGLIMTAYYNKDFRSWEVKTTWGD